MTPLVRRSIFGALYALIIAVGLLGPQPLFVVVFGFAIVQTMHEFYSMSLGESFKSSRLCAILAMLTLFVTAYSSRMGLCDGKWMYLTLIPLAVGTILPLWSKEYSEYGKMSYWAAGMLFTGAPLALTPVLAVRGGQFDGMLLACIFIIVSLNDVGAYFLGSSLGQKSGAKKLAPHISPKKSWWVVIGGCITGVLVSWGLSALGWLHLDVAHAMCFGAVLSVVGVLGDLVESMWKRYFSVKDSGHLIPGHGGLYDRLDSTIFAIVCAVVYLEVFGLLL